MTSKNFVPLFAALLATLAVSACKKDDKKSAGAAGGAEPFKGELTEEVLRAANRAIPVFADDGSPAEFAKTLAAAKVALGPPTNAAGNSHSWGFAEGDKCTIYKLTDKGGVVDSAGVMTIDKMMKDGYDECLRDLGKAAAPSGDDAAIDADDDADDVEGADDDADEDADDGAAADTDDGE